ncbi:squalene/phytoene synthase family protein, partial [Akkermansia sp.]|uniref:squalene/phytoene synthase family protein n=1 Tax=Akkermansia sp. TaxID=1872421 RepID=UPI0025C02CD3
MKGLHQLLSAVSRSFYLSMRFLPREMRPGVAVGYLLARATDTVADTVDMDSGERLALLKMMGETVAGDASRETASTCFGRLGVLSTVQAHRGEAELLARFPECLALLEALSPREQMLVRQVLCTIVEGQAWDLEYFEGNSSVSCPEQLEHYAYMVAGCVGEFWTRLGLLVLGAGFSTQPEDQLLRWGAHYGMGLQLVNILRDREEDLARGRSYLPAADAGPWLDRAERWLKEGVFYAESLRNGRLRFSTVLPAWLGLDTLELLRRPQQSGAGKV